MDGNKPSPECGDSKESTETESTHAVKLPQECGDNNLSQECSESTSSQRKVRSRHQRTETTMSAIQSQKNILRHRPTAEHREKTNNSKPNKIQETAFLSSEEMDKIKNNIYLLGISILIIILAWQFYGKFLNEKMGISVNSDERYSSSMFDMCLLSQNLLIATDSANKSVKVIDLERQALVFTLYAEVEPYCVTKVSDRQVAVTLPDAGKIQLLSVNKISEGQSVSLFIARNISIKGRPIGIEYWNEKFIVVIAYPAPGVYIINMDGTVLRNFTHFESGVQLFKFPYLLSAHIDGNIMYVTDIATNLVTSLTLDGEIKKFYDAHDILLVLGMYVDRTGRVYLCRMQFHEIYRLSPDLTEGEVLLNKADGIYSPISAVYDEKTQKLYVGSNIGNKIKIFTVTN